MYVYLYVGRNTIIIEMSGDNNNNHYRCQMSDAITFYKFLTSFVNVQEESGSIIIY